MTFRQSFPTQLPAGIPVDDVRLIFAGLVARDASGAPRTGLLPPVVGTLVTGSGAGMTYNVGAFVGVSNRNAGSGVELSANDGSVSVATTTAPGANSRIDVIWYIARFPLFGDAGVYTPVLGVTQGTASGTPAKPAIPSGAVELSTAVIPSTATTTTSAGVVITPAHQYTAAAGGTVWVRNSTELAAWTPADGSRAWQIDTGIGHTRKGGAWVPDDTGDVTISLNGGWTNASGTAAASYRVKNGYASLNGRLDAGAGSTTTGFTLPPAARPSQERVASVQIGAGNAMQVVVIGTNGNVAFFNMTIPTSDYRLASIPPWPVA